MKIAGVLGILILLSLACDMCGGVQKEELSEEDRINTAVAAALANHDRQQDTIASTQAINVELPTSTPLPCNRPKFQYENIPDNTIFFKNTAFTKSWTIRNDGTCTWDSSYRFVFTSGDSMSGPASQALPKEVVPGDTVTISINLVSPNMDGNFTGYWKLKSGTGELFGNYWVTIISGTGLIATETSLPAPSGGGSWEMSTPTSLPPPSGGGSWGQSP